MEDYELYILLAISQHDDDITPFHVTSQNCTLHSFRKEE